MNKTLRFYLFLACVLLISRASAQVSFGKPELFNDNWFFTLKNGEDKPVSQFERPLWMPVDLPHDWSVKGQYSPTLASATGYLPGGLGWYGKTFVVPEDKKGEKVYLYFEGVYNRSEVFLNGHSLGKRPNGYISFLYEATPYIKYGTENVLTVRVDHTQHADSRWYTGSGIYRDVWLVYANPVHIAQWGVYAYPSVNKNKGTLHVEVEVTNRSGAATQVTVENELYDPNGKRVASASGKVSLSASGNGTAKANLNVNNPALWNLDNPALYTLKTRVLQGKNVIDETTTKTGFRTFTFDPNKGFALNDEWMKMKGVCIHHDAGVLGAAVPREVWRDRILALKAMGCNAIRMTHNPHAPAVYELCDELGLLVMDEAFDEWEFPKRKWLEGWNYGTPGYQGSYDFFEEWAERDLADMVRRDRNHISIFAWSIGNEVDYPNDPYSHPVLDGGRDTGFTQPMFGGYKKDAPDAMRLGDIAKPLVVIVKQYDQSRPVTAGLAGVAMSNQTEYPGALDIAGYNYTESMYEADHKAYPDRVIFGSENNHAMSAWKVVRDNDYIFGQFLWTGLDYLGESGRWPSRGLYTGLIDFTGALKPRGHFREALWSDKPVSYLGTAPIRQGRMGRQDDRADVRLSIDVWPIWNYTEGDMVRVSCYTNAAKARLELNGKEVGEVKDYDDNTGIIYWDVPFAPGKLEVIGMNKDGVETTRYAIRTSGRPEAIAVTKAPKVIAKERGVACIELQVVDAQGIPVMLSDDEITCRIRGNVRLLGLEAANNADMSDYTDNRHRTYHGRIIAYVQATGEAGTATIDFTSPWLKTAQVTIEME